MHTRILVAGESISIQTFKMSLFSVCPQGMPSKPTDKGCGRTVLGITQGACWEVQHANPACQCTEVLESPSACKQTLCTKVCHQHVADTRHHLLPTAERWLPLPLPHSLLCRQSAVQGHLELQVPLTTSERGLFQETTPMRPDNSTWKEGEQRDVRYLAIFQISFNLFHP